MRWVLVLGAAAMLVSTAFAQNQNNAEDISCGPMALYMMAKLENKNLRLGDIQGKLRNSKMHSMNELKEAARSLGMDMYGVKVDEKVKGTMIALLKRQPHGHYVVVRPVGRTGKLVQIIDPNDGPTVVDIAELVSSPEWSGLALASSRDQGERVVAIAVIIVIIVSIFNILLIIISALKKRSGYFARR